MTPLSASSRTGIYIDGLNQEAHADVCQNLTMDVDRNRRPSMEIAKRVEEIGADSEVFCRATSDDFWSAYQQALKNDTRIKYHLLGDAEVKELFGL